MAASPRIDPTDPWLGRMQVIGRAQARYLWILLVAGVFFLALHANVRDGIGDSPVTAPFLGVRISAEVIWGWGPTILAYLVLVIMGSLRAYSHARGEVGLVALDHSGEPYDSAPNALDLAAYTTIETKEWIQTLLYFKYPLFLSLFLLEAVVIERELARCGDLVSTGLCLLGAILLIPAVWQLASMWDARVRKVLAERQGRRAGAARSLCR